MENATVRIALAIHNKIVNVIAIAQGNAVRILVLAANKKAFMMKAFFCTL